MPTTKFTTLANLDRYTTHVEEKNVQVTRDEYTNLPSSKLTDNRSYFIEDEGIVIKNGVEYGKDTIYTLGVGSGADANKITLTPSEGSAQSITVPYATSAGNANTVSNHTVAKDVPADAKFTDTTYSNATTAVAGLMSTDDKSKLDGIAEGATANTGTVTSIGLTAGDGISVSGGPVTTSGSITVTNKGVRSVAQGTTNGTINVNTNGSTADVAVKGLGSLAYKSSLSKSDVGLGNVANLDQSKAIKSITRSGTTFTATAIDGTTSSFTQQDNNTTYSDATTATSGLMSASDKIKLNGVASGAEVNQNAFSNVKVGDTTVAADAKTDTLELVAGTNVTLTPDATNDKVTIAAKDTTYSANNGVGLSGTTFYNSGVRSIATGTTNGTVNVNTNGSTANVAVKGLGSAAYTASTAYIASSLKGANNGVAELDSAGKVPSSQLPSFVDDVSEYDSMSGFPSTGESGKIYVAKDTNKTYRWSGTAYVEISPSLALGETSATAYRGDRGKVAYNHSQTTGNPHGTTKSDVGLGNVANLDQSKAIKSITRSGKTFTATALDGTTSSFTQQDNNTTYSGSDGITLTGTNFTNSGVRSIAAGTTNGTINVNTNGSTADVAVKGLGAMAYKASVSKSDVGLGNVANLDQSKAIKSITRSGTTFTATALDGTTSSFTQQDNNTDVNVKQSVTTTANWRKVLTGSQNDSSSGTAVTEQTGQSYVSPSLEFQPSTGTLKATKFSGDISGGTGLTKSQVTTALGYTPPTTNTTYSNVSTSAAGLAPKITDTSKYLKGDGTWATPTNTTYSNATTAAAGLMSKDDKVKLNGIATGATANTAATAAPGAIAASGAVGTSTNYARQDHTHSITVATGDSNGQVKIAGQNASVKGLGSAAYTASTAYAASSHTHKYAGSSSAGGAATSANKINTDAGTALNPVYFSSGIPVASGGNTIPFVAGTGSTAGTWLGSCDAITAYTDGLLILYKPSVAGASTTTLNINSLGAKTVYLNNTTKITTHYPANQPILLVYSTSQNSGCWMAVDNYIDGNSDTKVRQTLSTTSGNYPLLMSYANNATTTSNVDNVAYRNNSIYANPSTGNIQATSLNGVAIGSSPKFTDTTYSNVSTSVAGLAPKVTDTSKYLKGDGTWATPTNTTYSNVSSASAGLAPKGAAVSSQSQNTKFLREDGSWAKPSYTTNTNTTYTFANGTNGFTVTPSGGTAQTVTVTPSITNNVTGSGTSGYIAKFNGGNTITNGPAIGSDTTKYLRNDGTWVKPPNDNTWTAMVGATSAANGSVGYVNATPPKDGYNTKYLRADGTWTVPPDNNTTYSNVSTSAAGLAPKVTSTSKFLKGDGTWATPTNTTYSNVSTSAAGLAPKVTNTANFLKGDGTWAVPTNTWTAMVGATSAANGSVGYVNAVPPKSGYNTKFLRADGTWDIPGVKQSDNTTGLNDYDVLFSGKKTGSGDYYSSTYKSSNFRYNPSTGNLTVSKVNGKKINDDIAYSSYNQNYSLTSIGNDTNSGFTGVHIGDNGLLEYFANNTNKQNANILEGSRIQLVACDYLGNSQSKTVQLMDAPNLYFVFTYSDNDYFTTMHLVGYQYAKIYAVKTIVSGSGVTVSGEANNILSIKNNTPYNVIYMVYKLSFV